MAVLFPFDEGEKGDSGSSSQNTTDKEGWPKRQEESNKASSSGSSLFMYIPMFTWCKNLRFIKLVRSLWFKLPSYADVAQMV